MWDDWRVDSNERTNERRQKLTCRHSWGPWSRRPCEQDTDRRTSRQCWYTSHRPCRGLGTYGIHPRLTHDTASLWWRHRPHTRPTDQYIQPNDVHVDKESVLQLQQTDDRRMQHAGSETTFLVHFILGIFSGKFPLPPKKKIVSKCNTI